MKTAFALAFAAIFATTPAFAMPVLKSDVTVIAEIVTVGDMFDNAGELSERAIFRAPLPGTTGIVSIESVRAAAQMIGLADFSADGLSRIRVARASTLVDAAMLTDLITSDLQQRGAIQPGVEVAIRFNTAEVNFNAEAVDAPVQLVSLRYTPGADDFTARFAIAGTDLPVDINGRLSLMIEAPHLIGSKAAGEVITAADIEMRPVELRFADSVVDIDDVLGKSLVRQSRAGLMLKAADVTAPTVVQRNAMVTVFFRSGALTLTVKGTSLNAAAPGEPVQVLNTLTKKILHGVALPDGSVEVSTTISVAGL